MPLLTVKAVIFDPPLTPSTIVPPYTLGVLLGAAKVSVTFCVVLLLPIWLFSRRAPACRRQACNSNAMTGQVQRAVGGRGDGADSYAKPPIVTAGIVGKRAGRDQHQACRWPR